MEKLLYRKQVFLFAVSQKVTNFLLKKKKKTEPQCI